MRVIIQDGLMNSAKWFTVTLFLASSSFFPLSSQANEPVRLQIVNAASHPWVFRQVNAIADASGVSISGRITAPVNVVRPPVGHVDITAFDSAGGQRITMKTPYTPAVLSPQKMRKGGLHFSARIPAPLPAGSIVRVAFHANDTPNLQH